MYMPDVPPAAVQSVMWVFPLTLKTSDYIHTYPDMSKVHSNYSYSYKMRVRFITEF